MTQEPVMWVMPDGKTVDKWGLQFYGGQTGTPLYTHPQPKAEQKRPQNCGTSFCSCIECVMEPEPKAEQSPLTDEQIDKLLGSYHIRHWGNIRCEYHRSIARAIEAAHGIGDKA